MTDETRQERREASAIVEIQMRAADWVLDRTDAPDWSAEDQARLDAWLNEATAHRVAYVRLKTTLDRSIRLAALRRAVPGFSRPAPAPAPGKRHFFIHFAAAAAIAAFIGAGISFYVHQPQGQVYATAIGGRRTIEMADGTRIILNTDTVLRTQFTAHKRAVWLDRGEAYFQVRHDAARPFTVTAAGYRVRDLGTEFSMRADSRGVEVELVKGKAQLQPVAAGTKIKPRNLTPGDVVVATAKSVDLTQKSPADLANALAWRHGMLVFDYTTLADAAAEFNRYNTKKLVIADPAAARLTIMGKFPANNVELFGRVAKAVLGVRVVTSGDEIIISKHPQKN